jgi:hypothetical protein
MSALVGRKHTADGFRSYDPRSRHGRPTGLGLCSCNTDSETHPCSSGNKTIRDTALWRSSMTLIVSRKSGVLSFAHSTPQVPLHTQSANFHGKSASGAVICMWVVRTPNRRHVIGFLWIFPVPRGAYQDSRLR